MKMILSSAFSSGYFIIWHFLMYGTTGTINFDIIPQQLEGSPFEILAFVLLFTGFAFKLSIVPFHLWTADVYEVRRYLPLLSCLLFQKLRWRLFLSVLYTKYSSRCMQYGIICLCSLR